MTKALGEPECWSYLQSWWCPSLLSKQFRSVSLSAMSKILRKKTNAYQVKHYWVEMGTNEMSWRNWFQRLYQPYQAKESHGFHNNTRWRKSGILNQPLAQRHEHQRACDGSRIKHQGRNIIFKWIGSSITDFTVLFLRSAGLMEQWWGLVISWRLVNPSSGNVLTRRWRSNHRQYYSARFRTCRPCIENNVGNERRWCHRTRRVKMEEIISSVFVPMSEKATTVFLCFVRNEITRETR